MSYLCLSISYECIRNAIRVLAVICKRISSNSAKLYAAALGLQGCE